MVKQNCWEFKCCGREPGGINVKELGQCPAATEKKLDGVHDGKNAGRACWVVAGTMCMGEIQGSFAKKYSTCKNCNYYKKVLNENFNNWEISLALIEKLKKT